MALKAQQKLNKGIEKGKFPPNEILKKEEKIRDLKAKIEKENLKIKQLQNKL